MNNELIVEAMQRHAQRNQDLAKKYRESGRDPLETFLSGDNSDAISEARQFGIDTTDEKFLTILTNYANEVMPMIELGIRMGEKPSDVIQATLATVFLTGIKIGIEAKSLERPGTETDLRATDTA